MNFGEPRSSAPAAPPRRFKILAHRALAAGDRLQASWAFRMVGVSQRLENVRAHNRSLQFCLSALQPLGRIRHHALTRGWTKHYPLPPTDATFCASARARSSFTSASEPVSFVQQGRGPLAFAHLLFRRRLLRA